MGFLAVGGGRGGWSRPECLPRLSRSVSANVGRLVCVSRYPVSMLGGCFWPRLGPANPTLRRTRSTPFRAVLSAEYREPQAEQEPDVSRDGAHRLGRVRRQLAECHVDRLELAAFVVADQPAQLGLALQPDTRGTYNKASIHPFSANLVPGPCTSTTSRA
jgi:hypothetical protein